MFFFFVNKKKIVSVFVCIRQVVGWSSRAHVPLTHHVTDGRSNKDAYNTQNEQHHSTASITRSKPFEDHFGCQWSTTLVPVINIRHYENLCTSVVGVFPFISTENKNSFCGRESYALMFSVSFVHRCFRRVISTLVRFGDSIHAYYALPLVAVHLVHHSAPW